MSIVAPCAQRLSSVKDFWMVLQSECYLYLREGGEKKEFQKVYYFAVGLSAVVRQSGSKSQVSAAELCSLF